MLTLRLAFHIVFLPYFYFLYDVAIYQFDIVQYVIGFTPFDQKKKHITESSPDSRGIGCKEGMFLFFSN